MHYDEKITHLEKVPKFDMNMIFAFKITYLQIRFAYSVLSSYLQLSYSEQFKLCTVVKRLQHLHVLYVYCERYKRFRIQLFVLCSN